MRVASLAKKLSILIYYGVGTRMPQPPLPGGHFGNWIRNLLGRIIFLRCGKQVVIRKNAYFGSGRGIELGDYSEIGWNSLLTSDVKIGRHVLMGPNVTILTTNHEFEDPAVPIHSQGQRERRPVRIGNDVWIGASCLILPGVTIGDGAVIGAGSVVTHSFPSMAIVVGNPARVVRMRGSRLKTDALLNHHPARP